MANNILALVLDVLMKLPVLIKDGAEAVQLIESTLGTVRSAQAQGRDPTQAEWDAVHLQIDTMTGRLDRPEEPPVASVIVLGEAGARGDGTGRPTAKPQDVVGTAANPDPANVNPGPMFDAAHGAVGSTNVVLSTGGTMVTGGKMVPLDTAESLKLLDDHPRNAPSLEASQQHPVNEATGAAAGRTPVTLAGQGGTTVAEHPALVQDWTRDGTTQEQGINEAIWAEQARTSKRADPPIKPD